jgi:hypothetical protein
MITHARLIYSVCLRSQSDPANYLVPFVDRNPSHGTLQEHTVLEVLLHVVRIRRWLLMLRLIGRSILSDATLMNAHLTSLLDLHLQVYLLRGRHQQRLYWHISLATCSKQPCFDKVSFPVCLSSRSWTSYIFILLVSLQF